MRRQPSSLPRGERVGDKYEIVRVLGVGGMGTVYEGRHLALGQRVAIKVLHEEAARDPDICQRFAREARAVASLRGRHVAKVVDVDALADGRPYMVMEYLAGHDLSTALDEHGVFSIPEAVDLTLPACSAIAEAHARGIIHRDLKPANLFLTQEEGATCVKLLDFGISKVTEEGEEGAMTVTATAFGTPLYMSPEQIRSAKHVDERSDVWSLAVILYELLTGATPFDGNSPTAVIAAITADAPHPIEDKRPDVPAQLSAAILRALEKKPDRRHSSALDFAEAIAPFSSAGRFAPPPDLAGASTRSSSLALARSVTRNEGRGPRWWWAAVALLAVSAGAGIWAMGSTVPETRPAADPAVTAEPSPAPPEPAKPEPAPPDSEGTAETTSEPAAVEARPAAPRPKSHPGPVAPGLASPPPAPDPPPSHPPPPPKPASPAAGDDRPLTL